MENQITNGFIRVGLFSEYKTYVPEWQKSSLTFEEAPVTQL